MEKSALLQNNLLVKLWHFANVLMCVGKKAAGKKNKFWVGKVFGFYSLFLIQFFIFWNFDFVTIFDALHITEKVLAKDGLPCRQFQRKTEPEQNAFSDF